MSQPYTYMKALDLKRSELNCRTFALHFSRHLKLESSKIV